MTVDGFKIDGIRKNVDGLTMYIYTYIQHIRPTISPMPQEFLYTQNESKPAFSPLSLEGSQNLNPWP